MYHPVNAKSAHTLHSMEQELSHGVSGTALCGSTHSQVVTYCRQLFGEDEDASGELDEAEKQGENGKPFVNGV